MTPTEARDYLLKQGYRALFEDDDEDETATTIRSGTDGVSFHIHFWHEQPFDGVLDDFIMLTFFAAAEAELDDALLERVNKANTDGRFITAAFEEDVVIYRMDMPFSNVTLTHDSFQDILEAWTTWLPEMIQQTVELTEQS